MRSVLKVMDKWVSWVVRLLAGIFSVLILGIVLTQVLCRYVLHVSTGGIDELPTYFLVAAVWLGAVLSSRNFSDGQIKIDLLASFVRNELILNIVEIFVQFIVSVTMVVFTYLTFNYFVYCITSNAVTSALRLPMAIFVLAMLVGCILITVYEFAHFIYAIQKLRRK